ncbi:MAG: hypothetical protein LBD07_03495 [Spirochaetaceae bacterium]|jgi:hypothetical protein|nr:hypothetical protein [Spirochaetaceae bacterium]
MPSALDRITQPEPPETGRDYNGGGADCLPFARGYGILVPDYMTVECGSDARRKNAGRREILSGVTKWQ